MIDKALLEDTVQKLLIKGKGILAADESNGTADKRLESVDAGTGEEMRKKYRDLFLCTPGMEKYVSGVIMYDETFWQDDCAGVKFPTSLEEKGVIPGIKVDTGAKDNPDFPGEKITEGLEGLKERVEKYFDGGARFTKWRAVVKIDEENGLPTDAMLQKNAENFAQYAAITQEAGLVPIIEPEVLLQGKHSIDKCAEIVSKTLKIVFSELSRIEVYLPGVILKTSMVISGNQNPDESTVDEVADYTVKTLKESVPEEVGGIVFLSGGQTAVEASAHLDAIAEREPLPWEIAFSYARALQGPALRIWSGNEEKVSEAREEFLKRLKLNHLADLGDYDIELEWED
jgi:fructose-bisphosphate aldolase class I